MSIQERSAMAPRRMNASIVFLLVTISLSGCASSNSNSNTDDRTPVPTTSIPSPAASQTSTPEAFIQLSTLGIPAAWMAAPGKSPERSLSIEPGSGDCPVGLGCRRFAYRSGAGWAGIGWWPANCGPSGTPSAFALARQGACGVNVLQQSRLRTVERLSFQARGERGGETILFQVGADDMSPMPKIGPYSFKLSSSWQRKEIDLRDVNLSNAVALFIWVATDEDNPQGAVFYLDDIKFEGTK